ncbi:MAG: oligosaccharide repeat unit polymerase [Ruminococcus sp.]|nr:oligosaccharide repeat unit polymerase [Ruminococcus sp.]
MNSNELFLLLTLLHIVIWIMIYRMGKKGTDCFDSFYLVSGLYILIFVCAPYIWIQRGQTSYQGVEVMEYLPVATLVFNISYLMYAIASVDNKKVYIAQKKIGFDYENVKFLEFVESDYIKNYIKRYAWIVFGVSMILALCYYRMTGRGLRFMLTLGQGGEMGTRNSGYGLYFLMQFIRSAIPGIILIIGYQKKKRWLVYLCAYIICAVCMTTGSRNLAICVGLAIVVYQYKSKGKRPSLFLIFVAVLTLYLFVGFIGTYRPVIKSGEKIDLSAMSTSSLFSAFMYNVEIFFPFYTLVGYLKKGMIKLHWGLGVVFVVIQFIPRIIWNSKPSMLGLTAFEAMYGDSMGGAAYPNMGEFFYEFGMVGIIVGMWLFGYFMRQLIQKTQNIDNRLDIVTYAIAYGYMMQFVCRGHFASWVLDFVFMFGPIILLKKILRYKYLASIKYEEKEILLKRKEI